MVKEALESLAFILQASRSDTVSIHYASRHRIISACRSVSDADKLGSIGGSRTHRKLLEQIGNSLPDRLAGEINPIHKTILYKHHIDIPSGEYLVQCESVLPPDFLSFRTWLKQLAAVRPRDLWDVMQNPTPIDAPFHAQNVRRISIEPQGSANDPSVDILMFPQRAALRNELTALFESSGEQVRYPGSLSELHIGRDDRDAVVWRKYGKLGVMRDELGEMFVWANFAGTDGDRPTRLRRTARKDARFPVGSDVAWR